MQKKKGISLIVLVITIIVMIILAATIILAINNNNVVNKAKDAVNETNLKQIQELASVGWAEGYVDGKRTQTELETYVKEYLTNNGIDATEQSKYIIEVTTKGVTVSIKDGTEKHGLYFNQPYKGTMTQGDYEYTFEIYVDESGLSKVWMGIVENEYVIYMEEQVTYTEEQVFDVNGNVVGTISNDGKTVYFNYDENTVIPMSLVSNITADPMVGTYNQTLNGQYIIVDENNTVTLYNSSGEIESETTLANCIIHPSGYYLAIRPDGEWDEVLVFNYNGIRYGQPYKGSVANGSSGNIYMEVYINQDNTANFWAGQADNEYIIYQEYNISISDNKIEDTEGDISGTITSNGTVIELAVTSTTTATLTLSEVDLGEPVSGTYTNEYTNSYIVLNDDNSVQLYINDALNKTVSLSDCIIHPSGKHIAVPVDDTGDGVDDMWLAFNTTDKSYNYLLTVNVPQALSDEERINEYVFLFDTTDGEGDDGIEGWANLAIIVSAGMTEMYKVSDEVFTEEFIESLNVKVKDTTTGNTFSNVVLEKAYSSTYSFPDKDSYTFDVSDDIPNLYSSNTLPAEGGSASDKFTLVTENNIVEYGFAEETEDGENGAFFILVIVPEAGYYVPNIAFEITEPGTYLFSYSPDYQDAHELTIEFTN